MTDSSQNKTSEAVIIAAGQGTRIAENITVSHKCLVPILGKPLIGYIVQNLIDSGIQKVHIVTGYDGLTLQSSIKTLRFPVGLDFIQNDRWEDGNGTSVLSAQRVVDSEYFILTMADHWFSKEITQIINEPKFAFPNILAVDSWMDQINDIDDATKVQMGDHNRILDIDKKLKKYNAIDCGIFRFKSADIFSSLEKSIQSKEFSLSGGVRQLIQNEKMFYVDMKGNPWQDVDTWSDLQKTIEKINSHKERSHS